MAQPGHQLPGGRSCLGGEGSRGVAEVVQVDLGHAGDPDLACWAAYQGCLVDPTNLEHNTLALAAADATGNPADLQAEWAAITGRYRGQGQQPDPVLARRYPPP